MAHHQCQSLRLVKVEGEKPAGTEWYRCKAGCLKLMETICQLPQPFEEAEAAKAGVRMEHSFVALDDTTYETLEDARTRNKLIFEVEELAKFLEPRTVELNKGAGYIQQELQRVDELQQRMLKAAATEFKKQLFPNTRIEDLLEEVYVADPDHPLIKLYSRLTCIDREGREWQSRVLAEDPTVGKQVCLNDPNRTIPTKSKMEGPNEQREPG